MSSRDYFAGKRIALVGLGSYGEMVADAKFLIKAGALVSIYDLRSEARLKTHLVFLRSVGLANYVCGSIPAEDLLDMDLIVLSHEYPRDSSFLKGAREKGIPIEYPETMFLKLAPPVTLVAVMGACGKATVVSMLSPMLETVSAAGDDQGFFAIDPESGDGVLAHLKKIKSGDIVLMRLVEEMMPEVHALRMSPHVAIFTTVPPKGSYVNAPFEILEYQTHNNFIVAQDHVVDATRNAGNSGSAGALPRGKMLRTKASIIPPEWSFVGRGDHDRDNASLALQTARLFKISDEAARRALEKWKPLKGRLEAVKKVKNIEFYNDTASISPSSTIAGLSSLASNKNVVLILGGADRGADYRELYAALPHFIHTLITVPGSGTLRERQAFVRLDTLNVVSAPSIEEAARMALDNAKKGDRVLFSPGFGAGGYDGSRKERGERFVKAVRGL